MIPTTPDLAELRRLAEAATPGPWRTEYLMGAGNDLLTAIIADDQPDLFSGAA